MKYEVIPEPDKRDDTKEGEKYSEAKSSLTYNSPGVNESSLPVRGAERKVEQILSDIVTRLERIEEKIDENVYPPESAIKPEFVKQVKKARADIKKGKGKTYDSMDDFFKEIEA